MAYLDLGLVLLGPTGDALGLVIFLEKEGQLIIPGKLAVNGNTGPLGTFD